VEPAAWEAPAARRPLPVAVAETRIRAAELMINAVEDRAGDDVPSF